MTEFDDRDDLAMATSTDGDPDGDPPSGISGNKEVGAIAHLYRAEVYRSTVWRQRLDQTTNWAVISTGIGLSAAFASERASPFPIVPTHRAHRQSKRQRSASTRCRASRPANSTSSP